MGLQALLPQEAMEVLKQMDQRLEPPEPEEPAAAELAAANGRGSKSREEPPRAGLACGVFSNDWAAAASSTQPQAAAGGAQEPRSRGGAAGPSGARFIAGAAAAALLLLVIAVRLGGQLLLLRERLLRRQELLGLPVPVPCALFSHCPEGTASEAASLQAPLVLLVCAALLAICSAVAGWLGPTGAADATHRGASERASARGG